MKTDDKRILTLDVLNFLEQDKIFASGELPDNSFGINMDSSGKMLRWVAVKGYGQSWSVYCHFANHSNDYIKDFGNKIMTEAYIKRCVPCSDEAFGKYRY
jgi:hypothetical protein